MPNEEAANLKSNGAQDEPVAVLDENSEPVQDHSTNRSASNSSDTQTPPSDFKKTVRPGEKWMIGIGITALVMNGVIAGIYYGQLVQMRQATSFTRDALTNSINQFRVDERAWLEFESITNKPVQMTPSLKQAFPGLKAFAQGVTIKNYGRTIARNISIRTTMINAGESFGRGSESLRFAEEALRLNANTAEDKRYWIVIFSSPIATSLAPGAHADAGFMMGGLPSHVENGQSVSPYAVGRIDYIDSFGAPHWKTFCFRMSASDRSYCETGNEEDSNKEPN
jgi:hypothetical protein